MKLANHYDVAATCRGDAGYTHISCIVEYAKRKSLERQVGNVPWKECPTCNQRYQRELALDLANAQISFLQNELPPTASMNQHTLEAQETITLLAYEIKLDAIMTLDVKHDEFM